MSAIKTRILALLEKAYFAKAESSEAKRKIGLTLTLSAVGILLLCVYCAFAIIQDRHFLAAVDSIAAGLLTLNLYLLRKARYYKINIYLGIIVISILLTILMMGGGIEKTGFLWYFTYPGIAAFLLGSRWSAITSALMAIPIIISILVGDKFAFMADYEITFQFRFLGAYTMISYLSYLFEKTAEKNREDLRKFNYSLEQLVQERTRELEHQNKLLTREISERKNAEDKTAVALAEKEVLLKEVYHRTKNNMNVIISLLNLQEQALTKQDVAGVFQVIANRIKSMSMVHEQLYQSENVATIDLGDYVDKLAQRLHTSYLHAEKHVDLQISSATIQIGLTQAIPLGLALNEILTNVYKHAAPHEQPLLLKISLEHQEPDLIHLSIADNGKGLPSDFDPKSTDSLGMRLVHILIEEQLDGKVTIASHNGTRYDITFPITGKIAD